MTTTSKPERLLSGVMKLSVVGLVVASFTVGGDAQAQARPETEKVLNLYSARHYQTDEALYDNFSKKTGIKINRIELGDEPLIQRLRTEGAASPADVILLVDAARLWRAQVDGLFKPVASKVLDEKVPARLRANDGTWYGLSTRARVIVYNKASVKPEDVATYELLADPRNKGKVCTRSGAHPYMLSLIGSLVERNGEKATEDWARGMVANQARPPRGGDTDQIKAVASGECGVALTNSYYLARLMRSDDAKDKEAVAKIGMIWPNQADKGTHVNIAGGAVARNAPHPGNAQLFLEYLVSPEAQSYFANGNNEWPVVKGAEATNPALNAMGKFKAEDVPVSTIGKNQIAAQRILDRAGYR